MQGLVSFLGTCSRGVATACRPSIQPEPAAKAGGSVAGVPLAFGSRSAVSASSFSVRHLSILRSGSPSAVCYWSYGERLGDCDTTEGAAGPREPRVVLVRRDAPYGQGGGASRRTLRGRLASGDLHFSEKTGGSCRNWALFEHKSSAMANEDLLIRPALTASGRHNAL